MVQFYTKSSGGFRLAEITGIDEADLKHRESNRVANLSDLMDPDLALLYRENVNPTCLFQLRNWYTWAAPQPPEDIKQDFLHQTKTRWSEALQIDESSTSNAVKDIKKGRMFDA